MAGHCYRDFLAGLRFLHVDKSDGGDVLLPKYVPGQIAARAVVARAARVSFRIKIVNNLEAAAIRVIQQEVLGFRFDPVDHIGIDGIANENIPAVNGFYFPRLIQSPRRRCRKNNGRK
jgi:hypothetical protein